jgi:hypothetical protein
LERFVEPEVGHDKLPESLAVFGWQFVRIQFPALFLQF